MQTMKEAEEKNTAELTGNQKVEHPVKHYLTQSLVVLRNKYVLTIVVFLVWLTFFDRYDLVDMMNNASTIREMKTEKEYYRTKITEDSTRIKELTTNNENLEKYAREQYLMKKADEEIFIVKQ
jgi:cell division protein DivIC